MAISFLAPPVLSLSAQQWSFEVNQLRPEPNAPGLWLPGKVALGDGVAAVVIIPAFDGPPFHIYVRDGDEWEIETRVAYPPLTGVYFPDGLHFADDVLFAADAGGGRAGAVFALDRAPDGSWGRTQQQIDAPAEVEQYFGRKIAAHGDLLAVAASEIVGATPREGRVYLYRRIAGVWTYEATLSPPPGSIQFDYFSFGNNMVVRGDTIAVSAANPHYSGGVLIHHSGIIFVYERDPGGAWIHVATLEEPNPAAYDALGGSMGLEGNLLVAGRPKVSSFTPGIGEVIIYERSPAGVWQKIKTLHSTGQYLSVGGGDNLGSAVAIDNGVIVVGAPNGRDAFGGTSGALFVYRRGPGGLWPDLESEKFCMSVAGGGRLAQTIGFVDGYLLAPELGLLYPDQAAYLFAVDVLDDLCAETPVTGGGRCHLDAVGPTTAGGGGQSIIVSRAAPGTRFALFGGLGGNAAGCIPVFGIGSLCLCPPVVRVAAGQINANGGSMYIDIPEMSPLARRMFDGVGTLYFQAVFADYSSSTVELGLSNTIVFETTN